MASYAALERRFVAWAAGQPAVRAAVVVGSRARAGPYGPDPASDLDLIAFAADSTAFATRSDWLHALGPLWLAVPQRTGRGDPEWLALFAGGFKLDVVWLPGSAGEALPDLVAASLYPAVFRRGWRPLFDRAAATLPTGAAGEREEPERPTAAAFRTLLDRFWLDAWRADAFLDRGELWRAQRQIDGVLKDHLLTLVAWQATGAGREVWPEGRYLQRWADERALAALTYCFGGLEAGALRAALRRTVDLALAVAGDVRAGDAFPTANDEAIRQWLRARQAA